MVRFINLQVVVVVELVGWLCKCYGCIGIYLDVYSLSY